MGKGIGRITQKSEAFHRTAELGLNARLRRVPSSKQVSLTAGEWTDCGVHGGTIF